MILYEPAHFFVGEMTNARSVHLSVFPRRATVNHWVLGSVSFTNIRWHNSVFVGLAQLLILIVPILIVFGRANLELSYGWWDAMISVLAQPIFSVSGLHVLTC
ncbi:MAG TPA: hypothetical protein VJ654_11235 [Noviherbaspirillum sp.]|nr:hypothetical protein [Noviherbaspirillum sp.]